MQTFPKDELFTHYKFMNQTEKLPVDYSLSKKIYKEYSPDLKGESCTKYTSFNKKNMSEGFEILSFMSLVTWIAFVALLFSMAKFFWKKADK